MYIGIDVGGTKIQAATYDGQSVKLMEKLPTPNHYSRFVNTLRDLVEAANSQHPGRLKGIGIGIPGTVDDHHIRWAPNLPFLNGKALKAELTSMFQTEIMIENDAQTALLGEVWMGNAFGKQSAVLFSIGTGVGGAIMLDGKILRGASGSAGAFGWINLDLHEAADPQHGYLERHASGTALWEKTKQFDVNLSSYDLVEMARANNRQSLDVIEEIADKLGKALAVVASILDPQIILFSGGVSDAFDLFEAIIKERIQQYGSPSVRQIPVSVGRLGSLAGVYGAIRAAMLKQDAWI